MINIYNTLFRKLEEFKPLKKGHVGIYSCGPTVYWNQHIGHMYAYVQWDTLVRFLRHLGFKVKWVMNITDVGHMTSDEDIGEDKMEKGAKREGISVWQIADKYIDQFKNSMTLLNITQPDILCRATEYIPEQIGLIKLIEKNGFTYKTKLGVVLDTSKFPGYAKFARLDLEKQKPGSRVEVDPEKKVPWDPFLWVTGHPEHIMQWDSPWGRGFPGWHIECTAMSTKYLGNQFDIHTGGKEHIPVHHTNEIAQAYGAFGRQTANFWLHNEWLVLKGGEKMSKSKGNFFTAQNLVEKGFNPLAFRYLILTSHYRTGLVFSFEALKAAATAYNRLVSMVKDWRQVKGSTMGTGDPDKIERFKENFLAKLSADLNLPESLAVVWQMAKSDLPAIDKLDLMLEFDQVLGLDLDKTSSLLKTPKIPKAVNELIKKREQLRKSGNWTEADKFRKKVEKMGWKIEDASFGPKAIKLN